MATILKSTQKTLILLLSIAFLWQVFIFFVLQLSLQNSIYIDCSTYLKSAQLLVTEFKPHQWRPLGMALYSAIPGVVSSSYDGVFTYIKPLQTLLWLTGIAFLFLILTHYTSIKKAFLGSLLYVSCIGIVILNNLLLSEIPWLCFMLIGFYGLTRYKFEKNRWWLGIGLSVIVLSIMVRPISKFIIIFMMLLYWKDIINLLKHKARLILIGSTLLLVFQCGIMKKEYGSFTVSFIDAFTLYHYMVEPINAELGNAKNSEIFEDALKNPYHKKPYPERKSFTNTQFFELLKNHPKAVFSLYFNNQKDNFSKPSLYLVDAKNLKDTATFKPVRSFLIGLSKVQNIGFSILGILLIITVFLLFILKKISFKKDRLLLFLGGTLFYTMAVIGISSEQYDRLNAPNYALIILLTTILCWTLRPRRKDTKQD